MLVISYNCPQDLVPLGSCKKSIERKRKKNYLLANILVIAFLTFVIIKQCDFRDVTVIFLSFVQSLDVPSLKDKVRKMIDEDLVVSNFTLKFSKLSDMNLFGPTGQFVF